MVWPGRRGGGVLVVVGCGDWTELWGLGSDEGVSFMDIGACRSDKREDFSDTGTDTGAWGGSVSKSPSIFCIIKVHLTEEAKAEGMGGGVGGVGAVGGVGGGC